MKQYYCQSCLWDKHEIMGCAAQQLKWALEDLIMCTPLGCKLRGSTEHSYCDHFEPVELEEDE